ERYRRDAEQFRAEVSKLSTADLEAVMAQAEHSGGTGLQSYLNSIANVQNFKYSRLFAIGLLTAIETIDESIVAEQETLKPWVQKLSELLHLPNEKMEKDLEIYRSNLEKFRQAQVVMEDVLKADRKKREERQAAAQEASDTPSDDVVGSESAPDGGEATP
ncbi:MAG: photosystem II biogenesis protein Psp29, partial [Merismopedia sp. SIO2A8]|nr:photosystem II biogenesis protein Psp29 [Merismopedia sp. SIO2A8]